jgi:LDH2 family malate/lactate/ureidoglycolate dehydrogenase
MTHTRLHLLAAYLADIDPEAFGGLDVFVRQTAWLAQACRTTPPRPGVKRVRLPGEHGLARRADQLAHGVDLDASILPSLEPWTKTLGIALPRPL